MKRITIRLERIRHDYEDVYSYFFTPEEPLAYSSGQYVHFALPLTNPDAKSVREFSFASAPHEAQLQFTVDTRSGSPFQKYLLALKEGETAELFKTNRHMRWPVIEQEVVFIAGGIGATPFRSMALDLVESGVNTRTTLIHVARGAHIFEEEFKAMPLEYHSETRETFATRLAETVSAQPYARYYIAGSPSFVGEVEAMLKASGIEKIETDVFKGYEE